VLENRAEPGKNLTERRQAEGGVHRAGATRHNAGVFSRETPPWMAPILTCSRAQSWSAFVVPSQSVLAKTAVSDNHNLTGLLFSW
jgi:hypothetical protein